MSGVQCRSMRPLFVFFATRPIRSAPSVLATCVLALWLCHGLARAQNPSTPPMQTQEEGVTPAPFDAEHDARERARIKHERERVEAQYKESLADCYQRFAVNACLRDARRARRVVIDRLRGEEIVLDDAKRLAEAQAQKQRIEARQAERARQEAVREQEDAARARGRGQPRGDVPASSGR